MKERTCVCVLKKITVWPVCDQEFEACSAELNWCRNIAADGTECAHDEACHQQQETIGVLAMKEQEKTK
jgi:hypothetical protein